MGKLTPLEIRGLFYLLQEKEKRLLAVKPTEFDYEGKQYAWRSEMMWPANHPANLWHQETSG
jgi:hypothetical protein